MNYDINTNLTFGLKDSEMINLDNKEKDKYESLSDFNYSINDEENYIISDRESINEVQKVKKEKKIKINKTGILDFETKNKHTHELILFMLNLFSKIDLINESLFRKIIKKYALKQSEKLKNSNLEYFNKGLDYLKTKTNEKNIIPENYFEFTYEDFLLIFCSIINYFTKLNIKIKFPDYSNTIDIYIYGNEQIYSYLAKKLQYELQLKPYAYKYELYKHRKDKKELLNDKTSLIKFESSENNSTELLIVNNEESEMFPFNNPLQFEKLDEKYAFYFPPYVIFSNKHINKYRRYEKNDLYHECSNYINNYDINDEEKYDEICNKCSMFRNIDKLRLIKSSIEKLINIEYFKRQNILINIIYKRNYLPYGLSIQINNLQSKTLNFLNMENSKYLINLIRNYHGERVAFYFLYLNHYMRWLIFPSITGIIFLFLNGENQISKYLPLIKFEYIYRIIFCIIITFWTTLFIKNWSNKELFYSYLWGTENYKRFQSKQEKFIPDYKKYFIFDQKIEYSSIRKRIFKRLFSYFVLLIMGLITILNSFYILYKKQVILNDLEEKFQNKDIDIYFAKFSSLEIFLTAIFAALNAIVIKSMGFFYKKLAKILNEWENYEKENDSTKDIVIKLMIFEFINNYTGGFFIAFVKPNLKDEKYNKCSGGNCIMELSTFVYVLILIEFLVVIFNISLPIILNIIKKSQIKKKNPNINLNIRESQSLENQKIITESEPMLYEYNKILVLFGYICLFSASAPLTPIFILFVVYLYSLTDLAKKFKYEKVNIIGKSNGIEIYNTLMKGFMFVGLVVNSGIILFSEKFNTGEEWFWKILGLVILENFIIFVYFLIDYNNLPKWFNYIDEVKHLYVVKYYLRNDKELPHWKYLNIGN